MTKSELKKLKEYLESLPPTKEGDTFIKKLERDSKPIKVRSAKNKGATFQKEVAEAISKFIKVPWGTDDDAMIKPRPMGQHGTDIILHNSIRRAFPFAVECKNQEQLSLWNTVDQARANLGPYDYWIIFHKKNGKKPVVVMDMEDFFEWSKEIS